MPTFIPNTRSAKWAIPPSVEEAFTADAAGVFTPVYIPNLDGVLNSVAIVYGGTAPDALAVTVKDSDAIDLLNDYGSGLTATTRISLIPYQVFSGGLTIALTDNTVAGAIVTIKLYFI